MWLFLPVGRIVVVKAALALDFLDVVFEERGAFVVRLQVAKQLLVELLEHRANFFFVNIALIAGQIDAFVVFGFCGFERCEGVIAHLDMVAKVTMFDDIDGEVVDDFRIHDPHGAGGEVLVRFERADAHGVLAIFAHIRNHVGNAHHAALERCWTQVPDG